LDGTPHVLTIPELFIENIHTAEDYYNRPYAGTMIRVFRIFAFIISILLPGAAVAIVNHSPELLPTDFLINLLASEERTPFPFGLEILLMMFLLMVLRESGTRLPKAIGSAVSIVGALIIGDAAIAAGIVGAQSVILIALAAVCSYLVPNLAEVSLIYRFSFVFLGLFFGLLGLGAGIVFFYAQMASQTSFGVPLSGLFKKSDYADTLIRFPLKKLKFRPSAIAHRNIKRSAM
jgi:spore germination protein KA